MFVQGNQGAKARWRERVEQQKGAGAVARKMAVPIGGFGLAIHQRLGLCQGAGQQLALVFGVSMPSARHGDEFAGNGLRALMDSLKKRVLPIAAYLPPDDAHGVHRQQRALHVHAFAIAFHF